VRALILVDLHDDFLPGGALAAPAGDEVAPGADRHLPRFECAVAPRGRPSTGHVRPAAAADA